MILPIDYSDLMILVLAIFTFVGAMRGWYKEGITSLCAAALAFLVWKPAIAREFIDVANNVIRLFVVLVKAGFSLDPDKIVAQAVPPDWLLDPNSYRLYVVLMVVVLAASYLIGDATFHGKITPLGRVLGGLFGLSNGYVILALVRQYVMDYLKAKSEVFVASSEVSMQLTDVPTQEFIAGYGIVFVFVVLIGAVTLLIAGDRLRLPLK